MTDRPIRGKVARLLNSRELAINVGSVDGVVVGMYFEVLDPKGDDIRDPDSGKILGSIDRPKVRIRVVKVQDRLSVASTYKERQINVGGRGPSIGIGLSDLFMPPKYITKYETLKTDEKTWEDLDEQESYIKTGDPVVQVIDELDVGHNKSAS
jgi:hypothetical protein